MKKEEIFIDHHLDDSLEIVASRLIGNPDPQIGGCVDKKSCRCLVNFYFKNH